MTIGYADEIAACYSAVLVSSMGGGFNGWRNTSLKPLGGGLVFERFPLSFVELAGSHWHNLIIGISLKPSGRPAILRGYDPARFRSTNADY